MNELLLIDDPHHRFQKLKDKPYKFVDASRISVDVNQDELDLNWNVSLSSSDENDENIMH